MNLFQMDENKQLKPLTFILCHADKTPVDTLYPIHDFSFSNISNGTDEISFSFNSMIDGKTHPLYSQLIDFKLIFIPEWKKYYQIEVSEKESSDGTIKTITGIHLCEAELSQLILYGIEINTEEDILREDYKETLVYNEANPDGSLLHRILKDKAPHYSIGYISESVANRKPSFSIDKTSINDFLRGDFSEKLNCVIDYDSVDNKINIYDALKSCTNTNCNYRGEFTDDVCPKCKSPAKTDYGKYTGIVVSTDNIAKEINIETDKDSVKTCFRVSGGDDLITSAARAVIPSGDSYIYCFSEEMLNDMPSELSSAIVQYNNDYNEKQPEYMTIMEQIYALQDDIQYYQTSMMPKIDIPKTSAAEEVNKLTAAQIGPVGISSLTENTSLAIINNAILGVAKIFLASGYKIEIVNDQTSKPSYDAASKTWSGKFHIYNTDDPDNDTAVGNAIILSITDDYKTFLEQKINKTLAGHNAYDGTAYFTAHMDEYSWDMLDSYQSAYQACNDVLMELLTQSTDNADSNNNNGFIKFLYNKYLRYIIRIKVEKYYRKKTIDELKNQLADLTKKQQDINKSLNLKEKLGNDLWKVFCSYRRDDDYTNSYYTSDGLTNADLLENAKKLVDAASTELYKASRTQYTITGTISNFLLMPEFQYLCKDCELGNWIYIQTRYGDVYKLRLNGISGDFSSIDHIQLTFSNAYQVNTTVNTLADTINKAGSMATSYNSVCQQASQGQEARQNISRWVENGLSASLVRIKNNENEEVVFDNHGILARDYDDITEEYSPEQLKITHNILAFTEDNWESASLALGKQQYKHFNENGELVDNTGYGLNAKFVQSGQVNGSQIIGGDIYSDNYAPGSENTPAAGTYINLKDGTFSFAGGKLTYNPDTDSLNLTGTIKFANEDTVKEDLGVNTLLSKVSETETLTKKINNALGWSTEISKDYIISPYIGGGYLKIGDFEKETGMVVIDPFNFTNNGDIFAVYNKNEDKTIGLDTDGNAYLSGSIYASNGTISGWNITSTDLYISHDDKGAGIGQNNNVFWAGTTYENKESAPFRVGHNGALFASDACITGEINANSGEIGNLIIDSTGIRSAQFQFDTRLNCSTSGFSIRNNGEVSMTYGNIGCIQFGYEGLSTRDYEVRITTESGFESYAGEWQEKADENGNIMYKKPNRISIKDAGITFSTLNTDTWEYNNPHSLIGGNGIIYYEQSAINLNGAGSSINVSGNITCNGNTLTSDKRLKTNIQYIDSYDNYVNLAKNITPATFNFKDSTEDKFGIIAQDILSLCQKYNINSNLFVKENANGYYAVDYSALNMLSFLWLSDLEKRIKQ